MRLSPLEVWVRTSLLTRCTRYNIMWYSLSVNSDRSVDFSGYSTNKVYHHDITELLLNVMLNTITLTLKYTRIDIHPTYAFKQYIL